jgi:hypothetical protein
LNLKAARLEPESPFKASYIDAARFDARVYGRSVLPNRQTVKT